MIVREVMTTDPVTVHTNTTLKAALALLDKFSITSLPVVTADGRICGVVSEADLIRDLVRPDPRLQAVPRQPEGIDQPRYISEVMTRYAVTVHPETDVATAIELATSTTVKSLPVVDTQDRVVGMFSRRDVVRMLARTDDRLEREVDALLVETGIRDWLVDVHHGVAQITGPRDQRERALAEAVAGSVAGVVDVHVDPPTLR